MDGIARTILLVEDEAIIALGNKRVLSKYGYSVLVESSGEKAIDTVKANRNIDLILMDIDLGNGIDGIETAKAISLIRNVPILFLSSHTDLETIGQTEKISSYGYVTKTSGIIVLDASIKMAFKLLDANNEIAKNNHRLDLAMTAANMAWWEMKVETGEVNFDKRKTDMLGYSSEDFKHYTDFTSLIHPDDFEMTMEAMRRHLSGEKDKYEIEYRIRRRSGDYILFSDIGRLLNDNNGNKGKTVTGITINTTDAKGHC